MHAQTYKDTRRRTHTETHTQTHAHIHKHTHKHKDTHTNTQSHTQTHTRMVQVVEFLAKGRYHPWLVDAAQGRTVVLTVIYGILLN